MCDLIVVCAVCWFHCGVALWLEYELWPSAMGRADAAQTVAFRVAKALTTSGVFFVLIYCVAHGF
jgi:hypothetical protein